ncbi:MAG: response regulator [Leptospirales bacterium]|nr:response regulator [Leptospirales bacterium]
MGDGYNPDFDLLTLLKLGDLDIDKIAATKSSMTIGEYFNLLSKFTDLAPIASGALTKFIGLACDENAIKCLSDISILMTGIGCNKLIPEIDSILAACKRDDKNSAADYAKEISDDFLGLYTRTMTARNKQQEYLSAVLNIDDTSSDNIFDLNELSPLKDVLKQIDYVETARKMRILAVDDSPVMLKTIASVLGEEYKVFTLAKPTMVENFLHQITPDLFLLDYKMPELSGFDLIPIIRSFKEHEDTPIIFLTSEGTLDNLSSAVMLGACDFAVKPVKAKVLLEKVANHIVKKKLF